MWRALLEATQHLRKEHQPKCHQRCVDLPKAFEVWAQRNVVVLPLEQRTDWVSTSCPERIFWWYEARPWFHHSLQLKLIRSGRHTILHMPTGSSCHGTSDHLPYVESRTAWYAVHVARFQAKARNLPGRRAINQQQWIIVNCVHKLLFQELKLQPRTTSLLKHVFGDDKVACSIIWFFMIQSTQPPAAASLLQTKIQLFPAIQPTVLFFQGHWTLWLHTSRSCTRHSALHQSTRPLVHHFLKFLIPVPSTPRHSFRQSFTSCTDNSEMSVRTLFSSSDSLSCPNRNLPKFFSGLGVKGEAFLSKSNHRDTSEVQEQL